MSELGKTLLVSLIAGIGGLILTSEPLLACPGCKEAVAAQDIESDSDVYNPSQLARAYNYSIYLMLSMPYLLTGCFGAACYWMMRRARQQELDRRAEVAARQVAEGSMEIRQVHHC
ncbi:MAG: hypothetical protein NZM42_09130 [Gemmatales bacterium]|nr:hypothetical protein [Gemmatales bacterium]MDW8223256.1 hypothetical protein [Gemmatales bacterium]